MPQLIIDLDEETLKRIGECAAREKRTVSNWVMEKLAPSIFDRWPDKYFDLFGSLRAEELSDIPKLGEPLDLKRETL